MYIAIENGYFEDEGLDIEQVTVDAAHVSEAIGADQVDVGMGLIGKLLQPLENGLPIKFTTGIHTGCIKLLVPGDSDIKSVADLKGKKIGVPGLADAATVVSKRSLSAAGIGVTDQNMEVNSRVTPATIWHRHCRTVPLTRSHSVIRRRPSRQSSTA